MERKNNIFTKIKEQLHKGGEISPFLCVWRPLTEVHTLLSQQVSSLCQEFWVDMNYIFTLVDSGESLKISEMKEFIAKSYQKSSFAFQVFIIQNYSRATVEASNAALKFFEEPGQGNLIFLTSESEAGILDTILSRITVERFITHTYFQETNLWEEKITRYIQSGDQELTSFVYQEKIEQEEALKFLLALLTLHKKWILTLSNLDELESDMQWLEKNNLLPRYIVDKHFLLLG
jgi:DNA polymerase III delta prime subunit